MGKYDALRTRLASTLTLLLFVLPALAQEPTAATVPNPPPYDIISIHPHSAMDDNISFMSRPGNFAATNCTLKELVSNAYGVREDLITGLPSWADTAHFDVTAKVSDFDPAAFKNLTREQRESMLRPMLTDRFHVKAHTEIKTLSVFNLVLTKDGPKFKRNPPPPVDPDNPTKEQKGRGNTMINNNNLTATAIPLSSFAETLAGQLNHTVIDKTGLVGDYDFKLKWTPEDQSNNTADNGTTDRPPDLFTALQEQLGLKLEATKGPVTTLVVDHAEQPTPN
jgi:uncharacterized protein (TIGR03435 family)